MRIKFSQTNNTIIKLTYAKFPPIKLLPHKYITEFMIHWQLYFTFIRDYWCPSHCEFILKLHHMCLDWYERAPRLCLQIMIQSIFVLVLLVSFTET